MSGGAGGGRWELFFPGMPPNQNSRGHWATKAAEQKRYRTLAWLAAYMTAADAPIPPQPRIRVSAVVQRKALGTADQPGDVERLKPLIDGLVDAGVVPNDTYRYVVLGTVQEMHGAPGVRLIVEAIEPAPTGQEGSAMHEAAP